MTNPARKNACMLDRCLVGCPVGCPVGSLVECPVG